MKISHLLNMALIGLVSACGSEPAAVNETKALASIAVSNPSAFARQDQSIVFPASLLGLQNEQAVHAQDAQARVQWIDSDVNGSKESLLLMLDLAAGQQTTVNLVAGEQAAIPARAHAEISVKQGGRWDGDKYEGGVFQPLDALTPPPQYTDHSYYIRYEGPGIESDLIAYRIYLDWRNGIDVFGKTSPGLVLENVGQDGYQSYHEMSDWGMDIQKVGKSAGVGGYGLWREGSLQRVSEVEQRHVTIVDDGPLYASYDVHYDNWSYQGASLGDLHAKFSMQAGSRLLQIDLTSDTQEALAVALPKHPDATWHVGNLDITGRAWTYAYTLGKQSMHGEQQANFLLFQRTHLDEFVEDDVSHVVLLKAPAGKVTYYTGSMWSLEKGLTADQAEVEAFLQQQVERLTKAPRVEINTAHHAAAMASLNQTTAMELAKRVALSEISRHGQEMAYGQFDTMRNRLANWEYTMGLLTQGVYEMARHQSNPELTHWANAIVDSYITAEGDILSYKLANFNIDAINAGKMLLNRYRDTSDSKYRQAADLLREQLRQHPKLEAGAFWHKQRYPFQLWLDGVYMGIPFLVEYSLMFEDGTSIDEAIHEFEVVRDQLRDPATGLYWHAWDEKAQQDWADPNTGLSKHFWSRGMGWLAMAIVDTWALLPDSYVDQKSTLAAMGEQLAKDLLNHRVEGVWYQITDQPTAIGNYAESSASAMFTYFLSKGVAVGMLPSAFKQEAISSYDALVERFVLIDGQQHVHLMNACEVGGLGFGRDGSYDYYMSEPVIANDPKVLGPFLMTAQYIDALKGN